MSLLLTPGWQLDRGCCTEVGGRRVKALCYLSREGCKPGRSPLRDLLMGVVSAVERVAAGLWSRLHERLADCLRAGLGPAWEKVPCAKCSFANKAVRKSQQHFNKECEQVCRAWKSFWFGFLILRRSLSPFHKDRGIFLHLTSHLEGDLRLWYVETFCVAVNTIQIWSIKEITFSSLLKSAETVKDTVAGFYRMCCLFFLWMSVCNRGAACSFQNFKRELRWLYKKTIFKRTGSGLIKRSREIVVSRHWECSCAFEQWIWLQRPDQWIKRNALNRVDFQECQKQTHVFA